MSCRTRGEVPGATPPAWVPAEPAKYERRALRASGGGLTNAFRVSRRRVLHRHASFHLLVPLQAVGVARPSPGPFAGPRVSCPPAPCPPPEPPSPVPRPPSLPSRSPAEGAASPRARRPQPAPGPAPTSRRRRPRYVPLRDRAPPAAAARPRRPCRGPASAWSGSWQMVVPPHPSPTTPSLQTASRLRKPCGETPAGPGAGGAHRTASGLFHARRGVCSWSDRGCRVERKPPY